MPRNPKHPPPPPTGGRMVRIIRRIRKLSDGDLIKLENALNEITTNK